MPEPSLTPSLALEALAVPSSRLEHSQNQQPLCVKDPSTAIGLLAASLGSLYLKEDTPSEKISFRDNLRIMAELVFGVDSLPRDKESLEEFQKTHFPKNQPVDSATRAQHKGLMHVLKTLGEIQGNTCYYFDNRVDLKLKIHEAATAICVLSGNSSAVLPAVDDPELGVATKLSMLAYTAELNVLGKSVKSPSFSQARRPKLNQASKTLCGRVLKLLSPSGENHQPLPREVFEDGVKFLLTQGQNGLDCIFPYARGSTALLGNPALQSPTLKALEATYRSFASTAVRENRHVPDFPLDQNRALTVLEILCCTGAGSTDKDTREAAFAMLSAPLHVFSSKVQPFSRHLPAKLSEIIDDLRSLGRDLAAVPAEHLAYDPTTAEAVDARLSRLTAHLRERTASKDNNPSELDQRVTFDTQVIFCLAAANREEIPKTARLKTVAIAAKLIHEWLDLYESQHATTSPENRAHVTGIATLTEKELARVAEATSGLRR